MTALILRAAPLLEVVATQVQALGLRVAGALDAFGRARSRNAVTESQLRKARGEIDRCRRLMHAGRKSPGRMAR
jgi:hypothetical protein